ncbi:unnamed protein product [Fusarium graminearum]|uniref:Chromosome 2, complete genome n=1 Tax=Gibberella zeae (strain ATCC MYA-4620 / CBS 123657 / FGSC 9075 / NRRL 31084 / PH-1) TaxID=229533 RepID=A0A098DMU0_GIBZE|nr:unnamed protein product [Fusarium graminearum]
MTVQTRIDVDDQYVVRCYRSPWWATFHGCRLAPLSQGPRGATAFLTQLQYMSVGIVSLVSSRGKHTLHLRF